MAEIETLVPGNMPSLLLTTTGRKSGEKYIFPLFYGDTGNSYFVIASCARTPRLVPFPQPGRRGPGRHQEGDTPAPPPATNARSWDQAVKFFPPYADYKERPRREIPSSCSTPSHNAPRDGAVQAPSAPPIIFRYFPAAA